MTLRVAQHRDLIEEARAKITKTGAIFESAVDEFLNLYVASRKFKLAGDQWIDHDTEQTLDEVVMAYRETHPHAYADRALEGEELEEAEIESAMLEPTPGKLGALHRKLGALRFDKVVRDWGVDIPRMKPGTRPEYAADGKTVVKKKAAETNPWSAKGWSLTKQGELVKLGVEKAAQIAKAAGCQIGSTRPNPNFN